MLPKIKNVVGLRQHVNDDLKWLYDTAMLSIFVLCIYNIGASNQYLYISISNTVDSQSHS